MSVCSAWRARQTDRHTEAQTHSMQKLLQRPLTQGVMME